MIRTIFGTAIIGQVYGTVDRGSRKLQPEPGPQGPRFEPADQIGNRRRQRAVGLALGGHLFSVSGKDQGFAILLQLLPMIANIGVGLPYIVCWILNVGFVEKAQLVTFEYGNTFFLAAGLLNYLAMLDAFDIAAGRKE